MSTLNNAYGGDAGGGLFGLVDRGLNYVQSRDSMKMKRSMLEAQAAQQAQMMSDRSATERTGMLAQMQSVKWIAIGIGGAVLAAVLLKRSRRRR